MMASMRVSSSPRDALKVNSGSFWNREANMFCVPGSAHNPRTGQHGALTSTAAACDNDHVRVAILDTADLPSSMLSS